MPESGCTNFVITANTTGVQVAVSQAQLTPALAAAGTPVMGQGMVYRVSMAGGDTTAVTVIIYDGISTSDPIAWRMTVAIGASVDLQPEVRMNKGIFVAVSGGTTPTVNIGWR